MTAVVTVTVNPALDQTLWIPGFAAARVNRVEREVVRPGGKGVNVAARLAELGVSVAATGLLGNDNAAPFVALMADRGIEDGFVRQPGATRTGVKIVDPVGDRTTDINFPGEPPDARSLVDLEDRVSALAGGASFGAGSTKSSGSVPAASGVPRAVSSFTNCCGPITYPWPNCRERTTPLPAGFHTALCVELCPAPLLSALRFTAPHPSSIVLWSIRFAVASEW